MHGSAFGPLPKRRFIAFLELWCGTCARKLVDVAKTFATTIPTGRFLSIADLETRIAGGLLSDHLTLMLFVSLAKELMKYARKLVKVVCEAPDFH